MKLNKFVRSLLKTAVYIMDQSTDQIDRASERAAQFAEDTRSMVYPDENRVLRNVVSFAAGIGVGVAAGMLLAPSSGAELRTSIGDKVQNIGDKMRGRTGGYATGTEVR